MAYRLKCRPDSMNIPLFHAPIPNVFGSGAICWGTVPRVEDAALRGSSLANDWAMLLGSSFGGFIFRHRLLMEHFAESDW